MTQMTDEELQVLSDGFEDRVAELLDGERERRSTPLLYGTTGRARLPLLQSAEHGNDPLCHEISFLLNDQVEAANRACRSCVLSTCISVSRCNWGLDRSIWFLDRPVLPHILSWRRVRLHELTGIAPPLHPQSVFFP